jgi:hypothetical protein
MQMWNMDSQNGYISAYSYHLCEGRKRIQNSSFALPWQHWVIHLHVKQPQTVDSSSCVDCKVPRLAVDYSLHCSLLGTLQNSRCFRQRAQTGIPLVHEGVVPEESWQNKDDRCDIVMGDLHSVKTMYDTCK